MSGLLFGSYGVDMSNWGGVPTMDQIQKLVAAGFTRFIVGTGPGGYGAEAEAQIAVIVQVPGAHVEAYTFLEWRSQLNWGLDEKGWVRTALRCVGDYADDGTIERWWLDVEDNLRDQGMGVRDKEAVIQSAFDEFDHWLDPMGLTCGLYTGAWYWIGYMSNSDTFKDRQLWESYYDSDPDIDGWPGCPWSRDMIAITQYEGTTNMFGFSVDLNAVYIEPGGLSVSDRDLLNKLMVMVMAGNEEGDGVSFDQKLETAKARLENAGNEQSVRDLAYSAMAVAKSAHRSAGELDAEDIARVARSLRVVPAIAADK